MFSVHPVFGLSYLLCCMYPNGLHFSVVIGIITNKGMRVDVKGDLKA